MNTGFNQLIEKHFQAAVSVYKGGNLKPLYDALEEEFEKIDRYFLQVVEDADQESEEAGDRAWELTQKAKTYYADLCRAHEWAWPMDSHFRRLGRY